MSVKYFVMKRNYRLLQVEVDEFGKIQKLTLDLYEDIGCSFNDNILILTIDGIKSCYDFSKWTVNFYLVKTDNASSTWARAPGILCEQDAINPFNN